MSYLNNHGINFNSKCINLVGWNFGYANHNSFLKPSLGSIKKKLSMNTGRGKKKMTKNKCMK